MAGRGDSLALPARVSLRFRTLDLERVDRTEESCSPTNRPLGTHVCCFRRLDSNLLANGGIMRVSSALLTLTSFKIVG